MLIIKGICPLFSHLVTVKNNLVHFCAPFIKRHMVKGYSLNSSRSMSLGANLLSIFVPSYFLGCPVRCINFSSLS